MEEIINKLKSDYPSLTFTLGTVHCWSPNAKQVVYTADDNIAGLLHEIGHARLGHSNFLSDIDLLKKEVDAWQEAIRLGRHYGVEVSYDHMQNCLDSYRDWLFKRSHCPHCDLSGVQVAQCQYTCLNCGSNWRVTNSRLKRPYRCAMNKAR